MSDGAPTPHPLNDAITLTPTADCRMRGRTVAAYRNFVGPFGGATAAALIRAIEAQPDRIGEPIALTVNFVAPVASGTFEITPALIRTNRTNQHWTVSLSQGDEIPCTATAIFGLRRDTWSDTEVRMPRVPPPEDLSRATAPEGVAFLHNYDLRFVEGEPFGGGVHPSSRSVFWVRDEPARPLDFAGVTALSDIFFPRVFLRLGRPVPAGTISITTYFHADSATLAEQNTDFVLATASGQQFTGGYFDQNAQLWSRGGSLLVTSNQIVYYKDSGP